MIAQQWEKPHMFYSAKDLVVDLDNDAYWETHRKRENNPGDEYLNRTSESI